ncbi:tyrosine-type recombinase/integrase [Niabella aquatica]
MKEQKILLQVVPDYRRVMKDDKYPLKLKITWKGQRRYYGTSFAVTKMEWEQLNSMEAKGKLKSLRNELSLIEARAEKIANGLIPFSFSAFQDDFFEKPVKYESLKSIFESIIKDMRADGRVGNAIIYETTIVSLEKFRPGCKLINVTVNFLKDYEKWMYGNSNSNTTIGIYMRTVRAVINKAIADKQFNEKSYPFGKGKYQIPEGNSNKRALNKEAIRKIFEYQVALNDHFKRRSLDFWKFTYLANGINMMDIAALKWRTVQNDSILFSRGKTRRTSRKAAKPIVIIRNEIIDQILDDWGTTPKIDDAFVFDIAAAEDDPALFKKKVQQFTHVTNKHMKLIATELGISIPVTTYVARHSFSTILLRSGANVEFISESLGHSDIKTTQNYLAGFDIETKKERMKALVDFD